MLYGHLSARHNHLPCKSQRGARPVTTTLTHRLWATALPYPTFTRALSSSHAQLYATQTISDSNDGPSFQQTAYSSSSLTSNSPPLCFAKLRLLLTLRMAGIDSAFLSGGGGVFSVLIGPLDPRADSGSGDGTSVERPKTNAFSSSSSSPASASGCLKGRRSIAFSYFERKGDMGLANVIGMMGRRMR